ncbi:halogenase [Chloroflexia bacterium SDU3-3]|nr:halogenase [Chloroflexia bacterium SDU3-3]
MTDHHEGQRAQAAPAAYDVAILGGGIAALTLALQIRQHNSAASIAVIERQPHPVPEAAHKVGESTVEIAAHYLRDVLGLGEHLESQQLRKFGLRMFFSLGDNRDITRRVELGHARLPPAGVGTYQLDRGRLENMLGAELPRRGISFLHGAKVQQVELRPEQETHLLRIADEAGQEQQVAARWLLDGSGRSSFLKRQLGLAKKVDHHANSAWFRLGHPIDVNDWSDDPAWHARIREGRRQLSTNHLMGDGYWVWIIPLASGSTSIGIVADAEMHPFEGFNRFDRALEWLYAHEPQFAEIIERHREQLQDFRVMKDYSYSCEQLYSTDRWCLIGEAAVALDPLYSPGGDLMAISNGLVCDIVTRALRGEDVEDPVAIHNKLMLMMSESWLSTYYRQYPLMGNAQIMVAKVIWDTAVYWAIPGLLYFHDQYVSLGDRPDMVLKLFHFSQLSEHVQKFFRDWHLIAQGDASDIFISYYDFDFMARLHIGMTAKLPQEELRAQFAKNVRFLEQLAGQLVSTVIARYEEQPMAEPVREQIRRWKEDAALLDLVAIYQADELTNPTQSGWITLGQSYEQQQEIAG